MTRTCANSPDGRNKAGLVRYIPKTLELEQSAWWGCGNNEQTSCEIQFLMLSNKRGRYYSEYLAMFLSVQPLRRWWWIAVRRSCRTPTRDCIQLLYSTSHQIVVTHPHSMVLWLSHTFLSTIPYTITRGTQSNLFHVSCMCSSSAGNGKRRSLHIYHIQTGMVWCGTHGHSRPCLSPWT